MIENLTTFTIEDQLLANYFPSIRLDVTPSDTSMHALIWITPNSKWRLAAPLKSSPQDVTRSIGAKQTIFSFSYLGDIEDTPYHKKTNKSCFKHEYGQVFRQNSSTLLNLSKILSVPHVGEHSY